MALKTAISIGFALSEEKYGLRKLTLDGYTTNCRNPV